MCLTFTNVGGIDICGAIVGARGGEICHSIWGEAVEEILGGGGKNETLLTSVDL